MPNYTITGVKEIDRALRSLPAKIAKKVIRQAMRTALKPVKDEVKLIAPKRSGNLAKSIKLKAGTRSRTKIRLNVSIGDRDFTGKTFYGAMVELGTVKMEGQHFMER